jgi:hypothetical protein
MTKVRELLDVLGRDTLVRLTRNRGLPAASENDERRRALAYSYRGDVEALILDLSRQELVELFKQLQFGIRGVECCLPGPNKYRHHELQAFAIHAFAGRRVRIPCKFTPVEVDEGDEDDILDDDIIDEGGEDDIDDADGEDDDDVVVVDEEISVAEALRIESSSWSRPRKIERILDSLGYTPVQRLRTARFRELIEELSEGGVEACLAGDPMEQVLCVNDDSPGIDTKLRLRLVTSELGADAGARHDRAQRAEPSKSVSNGGPRIVIQAGEAPIRAQVVHLSSYAIADLRLRFLTSVSTGRRRSLPAWPDEYLTAATRGQALSASELSRFRAFSASLCFGSEDLDETMQRLSRSLSQSKWSTLLDDFRRLNPFHPELVEAIVQQVYALLGPDSRPVMEPGAVDAARSPQPTPETGRLAELSPQPASSTPSLDPLAANQRDLGALSGMFDGN